MHHVCTCALHGDETCRIVLTLPTEGNPTRATRASPDFITSNPSPYYLNQRINTPLHSLLAMRLMSVTFPADFEGSRSCDLYLASLALSKPKWYSVAVCVKHDITDEHSLASQPFLLGREPIADSSHNFLGQSYAIMSCMLTVQK